LEANPRASRTVPLVSKVCNIRMVPIAIDIMTREITGRPSPVPELKEKNIPYYGVKESVFPFNMFPEVDPVLGPEMRSTGEVLGLSDNWGESFFKAQEATQSALPTEGTVLIAVNNKDMKYAVEVGRLFREAGFRILATRGTGKLLRDNGIDCEIVYKLTEGRPNIADLITNGTIDIIMNSPDGGESEIDDSYLRKTAIRKKTPYVTTMAAARAAAIGILAAKREKKDEVKSLQDFHASITDR
ncbi:MAG: carbamoyl phosphate synthase large subunit, partial [Mogibacterium sp.]|nr:carbamoyl phosphate synthase large subunit [Mogibacterium sp.]